MNTYRETPAIPGTRTSLASTQNQQEQQDQNHHQKQALQFDPRQVISHQPSPFSFLTANNRLSLETSCKVNTTATTIELEPPCGISSLLPIGMSCRGRAEAFARRLQSRLRTLGVQVSFHSLIFPYFFYFFSNFSWT